MRDSADRMVEQWTAERPDLDPAPMGVAARLMRAGRLFQREVADNFAAHDLQSWEFDILATLRRSGDPYRLTAGALVEASMVTSGAITNRIDRLETRGLVSRETDPANRRSVLITLTESGLKLIDEVVPGHIENEARVLAALSDREQDQLNKLLRKLLAGMGDQID